LSLADLRNAWARTTICLRQRSLRNRPADIKKVEEAFQALPKQISQVQSLEWGANVSKEKRDKGFTHCFLLSFKSEADRDAYIEHPAHKAFGKLVGPVLDDVFVLDFWAKD
jgi:hypothetical protein